MSDVSEMVSRPPHYIGDGLEVIEVIENWGLGFHLGNALKYILRSPKKGAPRQDLEKAIWYLERAQRRQLVGEVAHFNAPFTIMPLKVFLAFGVPRGPLRNAIDDIFKAALVRDNGERARVLELASTSVMDWIGRETAA